MGPDRKDATDDDRAAPNSARATAYSHVGRRSSAGMPSVPVTVENVTPSARPMGAPGVARKSVEPLPPPPESMFPEPVGDAEIESIETIDVSESEAIEASPATERRATPVSTRPAAPEPFSVDLEAESIAQTFDRLLASPRPSAPAPESKPGSLEEVRALFAELAAHHARPVRDFLIDLRWGEASREWAPICQPAVRSLRRAAAKLDLADLVVALDRFDRELAQIESEHGAVIEGAQRDRLLRAHDELLAILPGAFGLDMDHAQRESLIVQSLLLQIPEVRKVTLDHLYAVGLSTVAAFAGAMPGDLAVAADIPVAIADRIVEVFSAYRAELHATSPDATRTRERARVVILLGELEALHTAHERAAASWSADALEEKKRTRRARGATLMQINVLLARLGEVARLREIERLPFDRKLDAIRAWLREAQTAAETM